jgi:tetratricopeptide (TPR) repeat protein
MSLTKKRTFAILAPLIACSVLLSLAFVAIPNASVLASKDVNTVDPAVEHYKTGLDAMKQLDWDRAIDEFLQATEFARNHYHPPAWYWMGVCYKIKLQDTKAIQAFKTHIEQTVGPTPEAHVELGEIYLRNNRDSEAQSEFTTALGEYQGPGYRAHNAMGKLLEKKGQYRDAAWHFLQALGNPPWIYTEAWMNLSENAMKREDWGEAVQQFAAMLQRGKTLVGVDTAKIHLDLGVCLLAKGDHQGAIENWQRCSIANPLMSEPHLMLGKLFDEEKHITSAIHEYQQYIRLAPLDKKLPQVKQRMAYLEQQIKPVEAAPQAAKPSPFMRQQQQKQIEAQQSAQDRYRQEMENLGGGGSSSGPAATKDSGF